MKSFKSCVFHKSKYQLQTHFLFPIQLRPKRVAENSDQDTVVGTLTTSDPDSGQNFTYSLLNNARGRFKIVGSTVKVRGRNSVL